MKAIDIEFTPRRLVFTPRTIKATKSRNQLLSPTREPISSTLNSETERKSKLNSIYVSGPLTNKTMKSSLQTLEIHQKNVSGFLLPRTASTGIKSYKSDQFKEYLTSRKS